MALLDAPGDLPPRVALERVPFFPQEDYYCGPAALAMALVWAGEDTTPEALVPEVYTPGREGTLRTDIVAAARRHGRVAVPVGSLRDLLGEVAAGHPVIVFQNLGIGLAPQWHFAVAVGYDLPAREILLHTGLEAGARRDLDTFERTWARGDHW
ncbi:MAG: PA2778 family cysteine peptidase, partial [Alphaproteobacteria bacterium]|nr:PA2778 family cysteine peptidase [Alphaproteobacteria bacterium]MDX5368976.1 PA2778 family cysteine peptidase [Alphaproteobacteria bacterium]MDX5463671.1 PA2778 family cysteine peptidase [Alphaproteobacteria bacterium]